MGGGRKQTSRSCLVDLLNILSFSFSFSDLDISKQLNSLSL